MKVKVPERHCTFVYDRIIFRKTQNSVKSVRLTGITEELHDWLNQRSYHYSVEETPAGIWVDFLEESAATDFRITWG